MNEEEGWGDDDEDFDAEDNISDEEDFNII